MVGIRTALAPRAPVATLSSFQFDTKLGLTPSVRASPECIAGQPLLSPLPTFTELYRLFTDLSDFLGRLQPSETTTHETLGTLGVEESTSWVIRWNITRNSTKGVLLVTIVD